MRHLVVIFQCFLYSGVVVSEKTPLVIFGVAKVRRVRISALLSGLKLEADLENGQASATYRQKVRGIYYDVLHLCHALLLNSALFCLVCQNLYLFGIFLV